MRALMVTAIVCVGVAAAGTLHAAPLRDAAAAYKQATQLRQGGDYEGAVAALEEGLTLKPNHVQLVDLLSLKGAVLFDLRDYLGALAAYQACLEAGVTGRKLRDANDAIARLEPAKTTSLDVQVANGPATIYLDSKTQGVFCTAAPSCTKPALPRKDWTVIAERPGFERWTRQITIVQGKPTPVAITLVEKPSLLTVRVGKPGAQITVDDKPYNAAAKVAAGKHQVVVALAGHARARIEAVAREGKPVEVDVPLVPLVPVRVVPAGATVLLDDKPVELEDGGVAIPPGPHVLVARATGFKDQRVDVPADRPADYGVVIELRRPEVAVVVPRRSMWTTRRKVALAVGGGGLAALAGGVVFGIQSQHLADDALAICPSPSTPCERASEANAISDRSRSHALEADIAYGVAGGAAIAAAVLWFTGAPESASRVAVTPRLGPVAGLDLAVRF